MLREKIDLDGWWKFITDEDDDLSVESLPQEMNKIAVPSCWQAQFPELREYYGTAWYQKEIEFQYDLSSEERVLLHFGAVDYIAEVWVNNIYVGGHEGGYTPFQFEVQQALQKGYNTITVKVIDPDNDKNRFPDYPATEIPHGKQNGEPNWYGNISGIWQSVHLEIVPATYFTKLHVTPYVDERQAELKTELAHIPEETSNLSLLFRVISPAGDRIWEKMIPVNADENSYQTTIKVDSLNLWQLDDPALYQASVHLTEGEKEIDIITTNFGFRKIEAKEGRIYLNGTPIYIIGALDQDFYPGTMYNPPSDEYLHDQFIKAKRMGLNLLRCHIKIPDPRYLEWADSIGLLTWEEIPNWNLLSEKAKERAKKTLTEMIERDYNHPSLIIYSLINEGWGLNLPHQEEHRRWLKEIYDYAKEKDSTRLIVDNSACGGNFHIKTDIADFHIYYSIPDHHHKFSAWVEDYANSPSWVFSPYQDAYRTGKEPLMVSEFGNWGLPDLAKLREVYGGDPWWMNRDYGNIRPQGVEERFSQWHLDDVFGSYEEFAKASQRAQFNALKYEIEEMRKRPEISGYVITEFTDLQWECNGLLDFCRNPKEFFEDISIVNSPDVILLDGYRTNLWSREQFTAEVLLSRFSPSSFEETAWEWKLNNLELKGGAIEVEIPRYTLSHIGQISFPIPEVEKPTRTRLQVMVRDASGVIIVSNYWDLYIFPHGYNRASSRATLYTSDPGLADKLLLAKYPLADQLNKNVSCAITSHWDKEIEEFCRQGGRVLFLADHSIAEDEGISISVESRQNSLWSGDWASNFNWLHQDKILQHLPVTNPLDFLFSEITPNYVITGYEERTEDVLAGLFIGWILSPAALLAQFRCGKGKGLITTFRLANKFGNDPAATFILNDLIGYLIEGKFEPNKDISKS